MLVGARQVGKSTMLKHLAEGQGCAYVTMDDPDDRELARLSFYRDSDGREIDVVVEEGAQLHPFDIKKTASPKRQQAGLSALAKAEGFEISNSGVICMADAPRALDALNSAVPSNLI